MTRTTTAELGRFVDRLTFRWERTYPHPAARLWRAVTEPGELSGWLSPDTVVDLRVGGECRFIWGSMTITGLDEPKVLELTGPASETMRFEVDDLGASSRLSVIQSLPPDFGTGTVREGPGSDLPAFPNVPWQPRMLSGIHTCLTQLGARLDGSDDTFEHGHGVWREVLPAYRELIANSIPGGNLARFTDRYTLRYDRYYAHPIERVWAACTVPEQMDQWMLEHNTIEKLEVGGGFEMTFGGPVGSGFPGVITDLDPPRLVTFQMDNETFLRFELREEDGGTWLAMTHHYPGPGSVVEGDPGGDLPGGADTPWRPGFVAGFHLQLDGLAVFLAGGQPKRPSAGDDPAERPHRDRWLELVEIYRDHIVYTIPGGVRS